MKYLKQITTLFTLVIILHSCKSENKEDQKVEKPKQPNIVLLLADDMGYGELGTYGQKEIKTPFLDSLASKSLKFTDFYAGTSVCSPSRAVLMTGMHTGHVSIRGNKGKWEDKWNRVPLKKSEITMAEMLKKGGYQTAMIGKWHLGLPEDMSTWAMGRGFDYTVQEQWGTSDKGETFDERMHWINNRQDSIFYNYKEHSCLDEFRTNFALEYLKDKKENYKPFFLYMSYRTPHAHEFFLRHNDMYADKGWPEIERTHAARITMLDAQIKRLVDQLKESGELENTIILFTSDNGPQRENGHDDKFFESSGGLKGYKRDLYEGGIREPMFVYWEGNVKAGKFSNHLATFYDVMPTFAEIANVDVPKQTDGISFLPEMLNQEQVKHDHLYWEIQEGPSPKGFKQAARMGKWKAVRIADSYKTELYDLENDKFESNDLSSHNPEIVEKMNKILKEESVKIEHFPNSGGIFK